MVQLIPVDSTAISAYGYDPVAQELTVWFRRGGATVYTYPLDPLSFAQFSTATSKGMWLNEHVIPHIRPKGRPSVARSITGAFARSAPAPTKSSRNRRR